MKDFMKEYPDVTRVEMIDANGRAYTAYDATDVIVALQDDGRTLKIMHKGTPDSMPTQEHVIAFGKELNSFFQNLSEEDLKELGFEPGDTLDNVFSTDYEAVAREAAEDMMKSDENRKKSDEQE